MRQPKGLSRRDLLRGAAGLALAAPYVITASALGAADRPAPSNRITVGFIWHALMSLMAMEVLASVIGPSEIHLFTCPAAKHRNFLDCVKARTDPYFPAEVGHRVASVCHIGNIAMELGRKLRWDPAAEVSPGDAEANRYLARAMRAPWRL